MAKKPTTRELRQRIVWRLFEARNRCDAVNAKSHAGDIASGEWGRAYDHFRRLSWELARLIHPDKRRALRRRHASEGER